MEKFYSINDLSIMTGLTTRTLRNYIKNNILSGEKIEGVWRFRDEEISHFISNPDVIPSIQAKRKSIISDFLADKNKNKICSIIDLCMDDNESEKVCKLFCNYINEHKDNYIKFSFEKEEQNVRIIVSGNENSVMELLNIKQGVSNI